MVKPQQHKIDTELQNTIYRNTQNTRTQGKACSKHFTYCETNLHSTLSDYILCVLCEMKNSHGYDFWLHSYDYLELGCDS